MKHLNSKCFYFLSELQRVLGIAAVALTAGAAVLNCHPPH